MAQTVIDNPVLNSPFEEPSRYFRFADDDITNDIVEGRRPSGYFLPVPPPKRRGKQLSLEAEWTQERFRESQWINRVRERVRLWREQGYPGITNTTEKLLRHWTDPDREKRLFFCQVEAAETAIYLTEAATRLGDAWIENDLRSANERHNPGLLRVALKMATGTGKTVTMGMLIAWQALNKLDHPQDSRFSDAFLIVTPNITIRDRLRVLLPTDPNNYYRAFDLIPAGVMDRFGQTRVAVVNFHAFLLRDTSQASRLAKDILRRRRRGDSLRETPEQMARRVSRDLGGKRNIVVL